MNIQEISPYISSFGLLLALSIGLWLAFRIIQRLTSVLPWLQFGRGNVNRIFILLLWLALGGLLAAPFTDFIRLIQNLASLFSNPFQFSVPPETASRLGISSFQTGILLNLLQTVAVYAFVLWLGWRFYQEEKLGFLDKVAPDRLDRIMILLAFAALVNGVVERVVFSVITILSISGDFGRISVYLIGWVVLFLLLLLLANTLSKHSKSTV
jgi:hypothetical protein